MSLKTAVLRRARLLACVLLFMACCCLSNIAVDGAAEDVEQSRYIVMIDAAHGGSDTGARIAPGVLEKDLTLVLAQKLKQELEARHIDCALVRERDTQLSLEQRSIVANAARPAAFISLHAEPGTTLRIFVPSLPEAPSLSADRHGFLRWHSAQAAFAKESDSLAAAARQAYARRELAVQIRPAFLNPLSSIAAPAIAVEAPANAKGFIISPELIIGAIADAVAAGKMRALSTR